MTNNTLFTVADVIRYVFKTATPIDDTPSEYPDTVKAFLVTSDYDLDKVKNLGVHLTKTDNGYMWTRDSFAFAPSFIELNKAVTLNDLK